MISSVLDFVLFDFQVDFYVIVIFLNCMKLDVFYITLLAGGLPLFVIISTSVSVQT